MIKYTWGKNSKIKKKKNPTSFYRSDHFWRNHPKLKTCNLCSRAHPLPWSDVPDFLVSCKPSLSQSGSQQKEEKHAGAWNSLTAVVVSILLERLKSSAKRLQEGGSEVLVALWSPLFNRLSPRHIGQLCAAALSGHTNLLGQSCLLQGTLGHPWAGEKSSKYLKWI